MKIELHKRPFHFAGFLLLPALLLGLPIAGQAADLASLLQSPASRNRFLPPDQAFRLMVQAKNNHQLVASFTPAPGYYLYRDRIKFSLLNAGATRIVNTQMPPAVVKSDPYFGRMAVYPHPFQVIIDLKRAVRAKGSVDLAADYQGCSERGLCYQPAHQVVKVSLPAER